ncbi:uncharacterized protein LOC132705212 isoform X2 [Cylas formicarius]|uniref:uncharacterized protein LOC132705212 isoform X2 n=1 Tax=Cylas formicarius TaxID=197179 RepID=UPI00295861A9|nr:uncharacterized protein LOC132705212 isoform X2 [Cylas formicarius]
MKPLEIFFAVAVLLRGDLATGADGPVFVNPALQVVATPVIKNDNLVTQTVYGFLDFTTTIGNTVMIFSPQSAAPATEQTKDVSSNSIIDTKPAAVQARDEVNIKPSKPQVVVAVAKTTAEKISSVVHVESSFKPPDKKLEIKPSVATKINIVEAKPEPKIITKVEVVTEAAPKITQNVITKVEVVSEPSKTLPLTTKKETSSVVQVKSDDEPALIVGNNIGEPEYDFLSRQPSEFVEETYKLINLKPSSSKFHLKPRASAIEPPKNKPSHPQQPTGLVSKIEGMVVKDGVMTSYETSVIGTYISGKYAQVLQSTSHVYSQPKGKINPSPSVRILKTAAPTLNKASKQHRQHLEPTPAAAAYYDESSAVDSFGAHNAIKGTRKPAKRFKNRQKEADVPEQRIDREPSQATFKKSHKGSRTPNRSSNDEPTPAPSSARRFTSRKKQTKVATVHPETTTSNNNGGFSRRGYKPKVQASPIDHGAASTSLYKFKLNRSPGRWQYKTTPKPRVTIIRKQNEEETGNNNEAVETTVSSASPEAQPLVPVQMSNDVAPQARSDEDSLEGSESVATIIDDESATENKVDSPTLPLETIKVEISTPPDFKDVYYEIATIKSPYTFQVGNVKNTRFITVTSTFEKTYSESVEPTSTGVAMEPLTENILATTSNYAKDNNFLDSSIATLPPIYLASDTETPPLETLTETFSTTQTMYKTHILPVIRSVNDTKSSTLVQTYLITRLVTATKTLPPMEAYQFIPSKTLKEFNSRLDEAGSELHLELEFGDNNEQDEDGHPKRILPADLDLSQIGSDFNFPDVDKSKIEQQLKASKKSQSQLQVNEPQPQPNLNPEQLQQLALLRLLNPAAAAQGQVITTSKPVIKVETLYETHVLPVTQGQNTVLSTISKVKGTFTKTDYEFGTSTIAPALPPLPQFPPPINPINPINPLFPAAPQPQLQPQFTVTSSPVVHSTMVTQTNSKVLKLTFGARTAQTTVFSTTVVPTLLTTYMTTSVPVAPTAAFPGYFPAPYPGYPFVG